MLVAPTGNSNLIKKQKTLKNLESLEHCIVVLPFWDLFYT